MRRVACLLQLWGIIVSWGMVMGKVAPEWDANNITSAEQRFYNWTIAVEKDFKNIVKSVSKSMMPQMLRLQEDPEIDSGCLRSLLKYAINLGRAKMWAVEMLDASSKPPSGIMIGTFSDFGSFDECLNVKVFQKNGKLDFQGSSCAIWMKGPLPPLREKITLAKISLADGEDTGLISEIPNSPKGPLPPLREKITLAKISLVDGEDTLGAQFRAAYRALTHKHFKFHICVPSSCSAKDIGRIAGKIAKEADLHIEVPKCYVKEETVFRPVHIAVITSLSILLCLGIAGSIFEWRKRNLGQKISSVPEKALVAFSLSSNFERFVSAPGGSAELKCIHGIRAFAICYVILGHTYVYMDFEVLKDPIHIQTWFGTLAFELIHNGWLGVEVFFIISAMLITYTGMKSMVKTKGRLNIPLLILRRYLRLTPSVVLIMGLIFFLPLMSSGPFWYQHVDPQIESCERYWWTTLLYFSNWWGIEKGCIETTWYLAADFQLHIVSLFLLIVLYRFTKPAIGLLISAVLLSCALVGAQTWFWDLGATIFLSTGDNNQVYEGLNKVHIQTFTHLGPHCIGMLIGYYIFKCREKKMNQAIVILGWCASVIIGVSSILGSHNFSAHKETSQALAILYAALHRCGFSCGIAWALLACITGNGGIVNSLLSSHVMAPISRLAYMIYLIHPLVIWCKLGSFRERPAAWHYDFVYLYLANIVISIAVAVPFYLLLESPLSNLERLLTNRNNDDNENDQRTPNHDNNQKISTEKNGVTLTKVHHYLAEFQPNHLTISEKTQG